MIRSLVATGAPPVDVHLMIEKPEPWAKRFAALGVRCVAFHLEGVSDPIAVARSIRNEGSLAYVALLPETPLLCALPLQDDIDGLLLLTAPPGGGDLNTTALARVQDVPKQLSTIVDGHLEPAQFDMLKPVASTSLSSGPRSSREIILQIERKRSICSLQTEAHYVTEAVSISSAWSIAAMRGSFAGTL